MADFFLFAMMDGIICACTGTVGINHCKNASLLNPHWHFKEKAGQQITVHW
jgi:hypothetical protein